MTRYFTNFSDKPLGEQPSGWSEQWVTSGASATVVTGHPPGTGTSRALSIVVSTSGRYGLRWDEVGDVVGDVEVVARVNFNPVASAGGSAQRLVLHGSGPAADERGYFVESVWSSRVDLAEYTPSFVTLGTSASFIPGTWHWIRLQRSGTTVRARWWPVADTEPAAWQISATDSTLSSGWVGLSSFASFGAGTPIYVDAFGVGTGGDSAPTAPLPPPPPVVIPPPFSGGYAGELPSLDISIRKDWIERYDGAGARTAVLTLKQNDYGLWQVIWPAGTPAYDLMVQALASGEDLGRWGVVLRQPGVAEPVASGPVTTAILAEGRTNGIAEDAISVWGVTDLTHLRERVIFPDHTVDLPNSNATGTGNTWPVEADEETGPAETVMLTYVRRNLGADALARRRLGANFPCSLVVPASQGRGPTVTVAPPPNRNVLEQVDELATLAGLTVDMVQTGPAQITVFVREATVRNGIVWSVESGTALGVRVKRQRRPKTEVIAGGSGTYGPPLHVRRRAAAPVPGVTEPSEGYSEVREEYIKGSGDEAAPIIVKADEELIEDGPELGLAVEPAPGVPWRVGVDYQVGDVAIGMFGSIPFPAPVRQVVLRHEDATLIEEPSVGFADSEPIEPVLDQLFSRIRSLEDQQR